MLKTSIHFILINILLLCSYTRSQEAAFGSQFSISYLNHKYKDSEQLGEINSKFNHRLGLDLELSYLIKDYFTFPMSSVNSLGLKYLLPKQDSILMLNDNNSIYSNNSSYTAYNMKSKGGEFSFKFGYEIPVLNDFLLPYVGWGGSLAFYKFQYAPNTDDINSIDFPYQYNNEPEFDGYFEVKRRSFRPTVFAGAFYELEFFRVSIEAGYNFNFLEGEHLESPNCFYSKIGIFIPMWTY